MTKQLLNRCALVTMPLCFAALSWPSNTVCGDEFLLKDGRLITGTLVSEKTTGDEADRFLVVEVAAGSRVLIKPAEIKKQVRVTKTEREYYDLVKSRYEDTVEYHLQAAAYCDQNGLTKQKIAHYERVLELDPEEKSARHVLGYIRNKDGRWVKKDEMMTETRGKILVAGAYRFPEMVALQEAQEKANKELIQLTSELRRLQQDVTSGNRRSAESLEKLKKLEGPLASAALAEILFPKASAIRRELVVDDLRVLYVEVFQRLADSAAIDALVRIAVTDPAQPIRDRAIDALRAIAPKPATAAFIRKLRSSNQAEVNAAARALAAMGDEMAVLPLIENLTATRVDTVPLGGPPNIGMNNAGGAGGLTYGNAPTTKVQTVMPNEDVLRALVSLTQKDFKYEKPAWLSWYSSEYLSGSTDLRRDP